MGIRVVMFALLIVGQGGAQPPAGKYLYIQPPPAIVTFADNDMRLIPVKFPHESPSHGIEIKPGVIIPYGPAQSIALNKKALDVRERINLKNGRLFFDGIEMDFNGLQIYKIREAYRWGEWIVCDGYSSASRDILKTPSDQREGLLPSELIYFRPGTRFGKSRPFGTAPLLIEIIGE